MLLAGLVWAERKQFSKASERAERRTVPDGRRESGKSTKVRRKFQTESLSEELTSYPSRLTGRVLPNDAGA